MLQSIYSFRAWRFDRYMQSCTNKGYTKAFLGGGAEGHLISPDY